MNLIELLLLAAIWGASFLFLRIGAPELGPLPLIALRVSIAAVVLLPAIRRPAERAQFRAKALPLFVVGITNSAVPFCLFAYSTLYVNAGFDSVLNATTPLWTALIALTLFQVSMNRVQATGLFLGLIGVVILVWDKLGASAPGIPTALAAALLAPLMYGFAVNYSKRHLAGVRPFVVAFGSQFFASLILIPFAFVLWPQRAISPLTWVCVGMLGIVCTGFAYVLYFRLVEQVSAAYAASVTFIVPIFGLFWGAIFLGERMTPMMGVGCVVVLVGTALASGKLSGIRTRRA